MPRSASVFRRGPAVLLAAVLAAASVQAAAAQPSPAVISSPSSSTAVPADAEISALVPLAPGSRFRSSGLTTLYGRWTSPDCLPTSRCTAKGTPMSA